jgi:transcriptional regulator with XRE-family HTH domain
VAPAREPVARTRRAAAQVGESLTAARKLQGLTADQVAQRANISRGTLRRLEHGEATVGFDVLLDVVRVLGGLERLLLAVDPYETDVGRARANEALPKRIRR